MPDQHPAGDTCMDAKAARRELGQLLGAWRRKAGLTQRELAKLTGYDYSVVGHSERGRPAASQGFWQTVDNVLGAGGALEAGHQRVRELDRAIRQQARHRRQAERDERVARVLSPGGVPSSSSPAQSQRAGYGTLPELRSGIRPHTAALARARTSGAFLTGARRRCRAG